MKSPKRTVKLFAIFLCLLWVLSNISDIGPGKPAEYVANKPLLFGGLIIIFIIYICLVILVERK